VTRISTIIFIISMLVGCTNDGKERAVRVENDERTVQCVGRYTISLPKMFSAVEVTTGNFREQHLGLGEPIFEVEVHAVEWSRDRFQAEMRKRSSDLKRKSSGHENVLRGEFAAGENAMLFRVQEIDDAYVSEVDALIGPALVKVTLDSSGDQYLDAEQRLLRFVAGMQRADQAGGDAQKKGFCLGPVLVTGDFNFESASFLFRDGKGDDLQVDINSGTGVGHKDRTLLERMALPDPLLSKANVKEHLIRARKLEVAGMPAEEWLGWVSLNPDSEEKTLGFALEARPDRPSKNNPYLTLSLDTAQQLKDGTHTRNWMADEVALHIWDSVVSSVQLTNH
jgi:hypothetical protein